MSSPSAAMNAWKSLFRTCSDPGLATTDWWKVKMARCRLLRSADCVWVYEARFANWLQLPIATAESGTNRLYARVFVGLRHKTLARGRYRRHEGMRHGVHCIAESPGPAARYLIGLPGHDVTLHVGQRRPIRRRRIAVGLHVSVERVVHHLVAPIEVGAIDLLVCHPVGQPDAGMNRCKRYPDALRLAHRQHEFVLRVVVSIEKDGDESLSSSVPTNRAEPALFPGDAGRDGENESQAVDR